MRPAINTLIINADDFGLNHNVNMATVQTFEKGLCSSCTIMPNMLEFEAACELVHEYKLINHVGIHLVLTEGYPLTEKIRKLPRFCDKEGRFCLSWTERVFRLNTDEKEALAEETKAQIAKCRKNQIPLTHLDSHSHVHEEWGIASVVIPVVIEECIPYVRLSRNFGPGITTVKRVYKYFFNLSLRSRGLAKTKYFGTPEDYYLYVKKLTNAQASPISWELMIHPLFDEQQQLVDYWLKKPLENMVTAVYEYEKAVSFTGRKYHNNLR